MPRLGSPQRGTYTRMGGATHKPRAALCACLDVTAQLSLITCFMCNRGKVLHNNTQAFGAEIARNQAEP